MEGRGAPGGEACGLLFLPIPTMLRTLAFLFLAAAAAAADLIVENFDAPGGPLSGRAPGVNSLSNASWSAGPIFLADGPVNDGSNTDQGAYLDLGTDFDFEPESTYTLTLSYTGLANAILFAGFSTTAANPSVPAQTHGTNFALRIREQATTPGNGFWTYNGASTFNTGPSASPAGSGSSTLTLLTRQLTNATASVDGSAPVTVNLTAADYRYLYLGYEDPTTGESTVTLESFVLAGPSSAPPPAAVAISPASGLLRPGEAVALSAPGGLVPRYTLDGSDPTSTSPAYTGALALTASGEIRARTFSGTTAGPVASGHFALVPAAPPNIVLILGERIGFGDLSCYGAVSTSTPRLDRIAAQGTRFTGMMAVGPGATSSPYALLTGRVSRRGDLADSIAPQQPGWDRREWTLAESLRKAGYDTAFIGAWKLGSATGSLPRDQGFQLFHGLPWSPSQIPAPALLENETVLDPAPQSATLLDTLATRAESYLSSRGTAPFFLTFQVPSLPATGSSLSGPAGDRTEAFDSTAGRLLDRIDQLGLAGETLVLFLSESTADRSPLGPSLGSNAPFRDGDGTTWDGGLRVPAIARWTGVIAPGSDNLAPLWLPDLCPSLAALANGWQPADRPYDGIARPELLLSARRRGDATTRLFHHRRNGASHLIPAVRSGPWKLHLSANTADPQNPAPDTLPLLFQTAVDPYERINLASAQATLVTEMQAAVNTHAGTFSIAVPQLPAPREPFLALPETTFPATGGIRLSFRRPADSLDDRYLLEFSDNLTTWAPEPTLPWIESATRHADGTETVVLALPPSHPQLAGPRCYVRLRSEFP